MHKKPYELIDISDEEETVSMYLEFNNKKKINTKQSSQTEILSCSDSTHNISKNNDIENSIDNIMKTIESGNINNSLELIGESGYMEITVVEAQTQNKKTQNNNISSFINFCIDKKLFDDTCYDHSDVFSIISTKLPATFDSISENKRTVDKESFICIFKEKYCYGGDLNYIYNIIDDDSKGYITWDNFREFFFPYIKNIVI